MTGSTDNSPLGKKRIRSVGELARDFTAHLNREWPLLWVHGEISGARPAGAAGHYYFTLKDEQASFSAVLWRGRARNLRVLPRDGLQIEALVRLVFYGPQGRLQLDIQEFRPCDEGALMRAFLERRDRLQKEGLFDSDRKKPLPRFPKTIGLLTARTGAALRDMMQVFQVRHPSIKLILQDTPVQGKGAGTTLAKRLRYLWQQPGVDLIILGRGGGSFEDLFCFSDEALVRAIADCPLPVVSAVGHEVDTPLSDLVADFRAPTPTAAAQSTVPNDADLQQGLFQLKQRAESSMQANLRRSRLELSALRDHYALRDPLLRLSQAAQSLDDFAVRLRRESIASYEGYSQLLVQSKQSLGRSLRHLHQATEQALVQLPKRLKYPLLQQIRQRKDDLARNKKAMPRFLFQSLRTAGHRLELLEKRLHALKASQVRKMAARLGMTQVLDEKKSPLLQARDFAEQALIYMDYSDGRICARVLKRDLSALGSKLEKT
jgi:exodeoxyribonuclease VII large subunit